jgi:L-ascorbate metabolism protein UlaG (beta-lactamase superfamily)
MVRYPMTRVTLVGGPTALIEYAGLRWLTDPTFSDPGNYDGLTKTTGPAIAADDLGPVDVVLLSHDHHADNLDPRGRELLPRGGLVLTTVAGAQRLGGNAVGLAEWQTQVVQTVSVTAVPALHGPVGSETVTGPVIGFVLRAPGHETVYVSGDNASVEVVREVAQRLGPIEVSLLFAGAVQLPHRFGGAYLTLSGDRAAQAAEILGARAVVPLHFEGWAHFSQGLDQIRASFAGYQLSDRLAVVERGETVEL